MSAPHSHPHPHTSNTSAAAPPRRRELLSLDGYLDRKLNVKMVGGREVTGVLRGFDTVMNLVLEDCTEYIRAADDSQARFTDAHGQTRTRSLGVAILRGNQIMRIAPADGSSAVIMEDDESMQEGSQSAVL